MRDIKKYRELLSPEAYSRLSNKAVGHTSGKSIVSGIFSADDATRLRLGKLPTNSKH